MGNKEIPEIIYGKTVLETIWGSLGLSSYFKKKKKKNNPRRVPEPS